MNILHEAPRFSWLFGGKDRDPSPSWDSVLWETPSFAVLPSLGSLVPGWLLVVPKRRMPNLVELHDNEVEELEDLVSVASKKLKMFPGQAQMFEHGGPLGSSLSCGVDQAHLHIVPLGFNVVELSRDDKSISWLPVTGFGDIRSQTSNGTEYLYVSTLGQSLLGFPSVPTSQWFRRLIADRIGVPEEWNYREFPKLEVMEETRARLAA